MAGALLPLADVPDPVFASKLMGDGFAVEPDGAGRVTLGGPAGEVIPVSEAPAVPATPVSPVDVVPVAVEDPERAGLGTHDRIAYDILANIGGAANVKRVLHCITRVRFYLRDEGIADDAAVAGIDGVIDIAKAGGQYQVVIGPGVEDVYNAIVARMGGGGAAAVDENEEDEPKPDTALGWVKYGFSQLIGVITGSMIPVVGVMAASGILKGLLALLTQFNVVAGDSDTYRLISAMSDSMFIQAWMTGSGASVYATPA